MKEEETKSVERILRKRKQSKYLMQKEVLCHMHELAPLTATRLEAGNITADNKFLLRCEIINNQ
jgi:hypothetical protein